VPEALLGASLWRVLAGAVCKTPSRRSVRIPINDSKKLYAGLRGKKGLAHLERGVLAALGGRPRPPGSLRELMAEVCPGAIRHLAAYPWHAGADLPLPQGLDATEAALSANALATAMERSGLALHCLRSECVFPGEYNRLVQAANNKATMLLDVTCRLLMHLWQTAGRQALRIYVDHQGGRVHYLPTLLRLFEGCRAKVLAEDRDLSAYRLSDGEKVAELYFLPQAERHHLTTALASMLSKYLRELFMGMFNAYWAAQVPDIAPTAGYYEDGNRFYRQIQGRLKPLGLDERLVYRSR
jgi:hypothetical protein